MNQADFRADNPYASFGTMAADAPPDARVAFLKRTYSHLAMAIYGLVAIEFIIFNIPGSDALAQKMFSSGIGWLLILGGFMLIGNLAQRMAHSQASLQTQYIGLFIYVLAEAIVLFPLLWIANHYSTTLAEGVTMSPIALAAIATLLLFSGLTAAVLLTKRDFSFLGPALSIAGIVALGVVVLISLGVVNPSIYFIALMVVFASGYTLYYTSQILHHYSTDQHVAASLALFASVALMFWYILQIVLRFSSRD